MSKLPAPAEFDFAQPEEWPNWRKRFERYRSATELNKADEERQVNTLIYTMGPQAETIFAQLGLTEAQRVNKKNVSDAFDKYFQLIHWRSIFHQRFQKSDESIEAYLRALFELVGKCNYENGDEEIRDQFVVGITDRDLKKELQSDAELTLDRAIEKARQAELINFQVGIQPG